MGHPDRCRRQDDGGIDAEDRNGSSWPQEASRVVDRDGGLERGPGQVLTKAGRKQLAERDAPHDDQHQVPWSLLRCVG